MLCKLWNDFSFVNYFPKNITRLFAAYSSLKMRNRSNQLLLIASSIKPDSRQDIVFTESVSVFLVFLRTWQIQPVILQCRSPRLPLLLRCCLDWKKNRYTCYSTPLIILLPHYIEGLTGISFLYRNKEMGHHDW